jgi:hypothetical protein
MQQYYQSILPLMTRSLYLPLVPGFGNSIDRDTNLMRDRLNSKPDLSQIPIILMRLNFMYYI